MKKIIANCGGKGGKPGPCPRGGAGTPPAAKTGASGNSAASTVEKLGRGGKDLPADWKEELKKHDTKAVSEVLKAVPGLHVQKITGDMVHEPKIEGTIGDRVSHSSVIKELKSQGFKAPSKWNSEHRQTFVHPDGHQLTVFKKGGVGGKKVHYYPQYPMPKLSGSKS